MKKLFSALVLLLALNFLALAGGAGWLYKTGQVDKQKLTQMRAILFPPPAPPATQPSESEAPAKVDPLAQLLAKQSGHSATEQVQFIQKTVDAQMLQIDRRQQELLDLQRQVDLANQKLAHDRQELEAQKKDLAQQQQQAAKLETDKGFQDSLALYETLPGKQVKTIFISLGEATATQYLQAMQPRSASKIIKEFKTPDEIAFIQKVLERMRLAQQTPDPTNPAPAAATPASEKQP